MIRSVLLALLATSALATTAAAQEIVLRRKVMPAQPNAGASTEGTSPTPDARSGRWTPAAIALTTRTYAPSDAAATVSITQYRCLDGQGLDATCAGSPPSGETRAIGAAINHSLNKVFLDRTTLGDIAESVDTNVICNLAVTVGGAPGWGTSCSELHRPQADKRWLITKLTARTGVYSGTEASTAFNAVYDCYDTSRTPAVPAGQVCAEARPSSLITLPVTPRASMHRILVDPGSTAMTDQARIGLCGHGFKAANGETWTTTCDPTAIAGDYFRRSSVIQVRDTVKPTDGMMTIFIGSLACYDAATGARTADQGRCTTATPIVGIANETRTYSIKHSANLLTVVPDESFFADSAGVEGLPAFCQSQFTGLAPGGGFATSWKMRCNEATLIEHHVKIPTRITSVSFTRPLQPDLFPASTSASGVMCRNLETGAIEPLTNCSTYQNNAEVGIIHVPAVHDESIRTVWFDPDRIIERYPTITRQSVIDACSIYGRDIEDVTNNGRIVWRVVCDRSEVDAALYERRINSINENGYTSQPDTVTTTYSSACYNKTTNSSVNSVHCSADPYPTTGNVSVPVIYNHNNAVAYVDRAALNPRNAEICRNADLRSVSVQVAAPTLGGYLHNYRISCDPADRTDTATTHVTALLGGELTIHPTTTVRVFGQNKTPTSSDVSLLVRTDCRRGGVNVSRLDCIGEDDLLEGLALRSNPANDARFSLPVPARRDYANGIAWIHRAQTIARYPSLTTSNLPCSGQYVNVTNPSGTTQRLRILCEG